MFKSKAELAGKIAQEKKAPLDLMTRQITEAERKRALKGRKGNNDKEKGSVSVHA